MVRKRCIDTTKKVTGQHAIRCDNDQSLLIQTQGTVLEEAQHIVNGDKRDEYGDRVETFGRIASFWTIILGIEVSSQQVAQCMVALKLSREIFKHKRDNLVDIGGYVYLMELLNEPV